VHESLRSCPSGFKAAQGRRIKFIANVDPLDFFRAVEGLDASETLVIINSKTFTTAETMLNARTVVNWLIDEHKKLGVKVDTEEDRKKIVNAHMAAGSTALEETRKFGISDDKVFGFWDFVGGRFSVWSTVGVLPLSLHYGFDIMREFLDGGHNVDEHFINTK
jgi:glucose-6-phosphate isomerase